MNRTVRFVVQGEPIPKGRPRIVHRGDKSWAYTPAQTKAAQDFIGWMFRATGEKPFSREILLRVELTFYSTRRAIDPPDLDNLAKLVLDGLNKVAFEDDSQIVELEMAKAKYIKPCTSIVIKTLNP